MKFTKMHGLGNDFIVIENPDKQPLNYPELAVNLCHRRFSIGADGILIVEDSDNADIMMRIFNSDGSEAKMCGNGIRCFARYVFDRNIVPKTKMTVETISVTVSPEIITDENGETVVTVDMGKPILKKSLIPVAGEEEEPVKDKKVEIDGEEFTFSAVSMGNPHCLIFVDEITDRLVREVGPKIEVHPLFPEKTNVEFIKVLSRNHIQVRVWERGAGETMACGTGACASVVAGIIKGLLDNRVKVSLPGGDLDITWTQGESVFMTGPAAEVCTGEVLL
ncbi:MAG: diaminopimelate epimerase [Firmicutes bacterium]|nr:diaminopimelate epimerase [Bacillota bacterium]